MSQDLQTFGIRVIEEKYIRPVNLFLKDFGVSYCRTMNSIKSSLAYQLKFLMTVEFLEKCRAKVV